MKNILIGSVVSSWVVLDEMIKTGFPVDMVFSLDEAYSENVSGYRPIHELAQVNGIPYKKFRRINDEENIRLISELQPDYIFVIGLSQIVKKDIIDAADKGSIGFHPTPLPKFRGRAAMVWQMLLGVHETKCSLFFIDQGMDSGDIINQEPYVIEDTDYAADVEEKLLAALSRLIRKTLEEIKSGSLSPWKQDESKATYLLKRTPEDGEIRWGALLREIHTLVRAVSRPYPGAFSYYEGCHKVIFWKADMLANNKYVGIPGQIAEIDAGHMDIVAKDGILRVYEWENVDGVKIIAGHKFQQERAK